MLLSPEIIVGETGGASLGRGLTLRFEDFLIVIIGFSWFTKNAIYKELGRAGGRQHRFVVCVKIY